MDPSHSHQPFDSTPITSTYVPEDVTALNISPLTTLTLNEVNRVDQAQAESQVQPQVEPEVQPHAASESALVPAQPSSTRRPYTDMIYDAVVALKEPQGSSKWAILNYIRKSNTNLPDGHEELITHHLKVMKNCGILTMVKKSYKLAGSSPPENVAAAAVDAGLVASGSETPPSPLDMLAVSAAAVDTGRVLASGSEIPPTNTSSLDMLALTAAGSASQPLKRGRGRPPKPKTGAPQQQQPIAAQPISQALQPSMDVEPSDVQPSEVQPELPVTDPSPESAKRGRGRPRKDGSGPSVPAPGLAVTMKRRGWPMSCRASGRERKPISVPAPAFVVPVVAHGAGRPESPRRGESGGVATIDPAGEEAMAVAAVMKRGRGRPPKRGRGRTAGRRPIQATPRPVTRAIGTTQESAYGELKRKIDLASEKVKEILSVLDAGIATGDNQAGAQAAQELEALILMLTVDPQAMEEVPPEEATPQIEAETQGMELGQGSEGGGEQAQIQTLILTQPQPQTLTQPQIMLEPQVELEPLPELEPLLELEPLPLTQPQRQILPQIQPNTDSESEAMDEDMP